MRITANFHKKVPVPGVEYASQGYACEIQVEPPPEVQEDREKLRRYVLALFQETRERVEEQIAQGQEPTRSNGQAGRPAHGRRQFVAPRRQSAHRNAATNGQNGTTNIASPKQLKFVRALGSDAGMSHEDLGDMAFEAFGINDLRSLTKKQASRLIEDLLGPDRS